MTAEPPGSSRPPSPAPARLPRNLPQRYAAAVAAGKAPLAARAAAWLDQRTGYSAVVRLITDEPIPGGARWWYVFGAVLTFLLGLEFLTGMALASAYAPSVTTAWASTAFIQDTLTLGWFIRGLHSFGSTAMIVLAGIHLVQVLIFGAYKAPREMNWLVGLAMLGLLVVFALTGHGLPWDERGYWAKQVETSIVGTVPLVGAWLQTLLQGGDGYGNYTVTRFYALHTFLLPSTMVLALAVHLFLVRRHGVTPRWNKDEATLAHATQSYWPGQALRDTTACGVTLVILALVVIKTHGAPLDAPVDPLASSQVRPEWYALPLFQLRHYFGGALELVGTMVIPGVAAMLLAALPWLDAGPSRDPLRRKLVMVGALFGAAALGVLGYLPLRHDHGDPVFQRARAEAAVRSRRARELARGGVPPEGGLAVFRNDPLYQARELWEEHCADCHAFT
ncbi:MAG: cytochrome bc complex cytochrome b subunit, partial [Polyangia bacterium]